MKLEFTIEGLKDVDEAIRVLSFLRAGYTDTPLVVAPGLYTGDYNAKSAALAEEGSVFPTEAYNASAEEEVIPPVLSAEPPKLFDGSPAESTVRRKRRTKAEMEAARAAEAAVKATVDEAISEALASDDEGADLHSLLDVSEDDAPEEPVYNRADLEAKARERAKAAGGRAWLVEKVLCGQKYPNVSSVPDAVLAAALAG